MLWRIIKTKKGTGLAYHSDLFKEWVGVLGIPFLVGLSWASVATMGIPW